MNRLGEHQRKWTAFEEGLFKTFWEANLPEQFIAHEFDISQSAVSYKSKKLGLDPRRGRNRVPTMLRPELIAYVKGLIKDYRAEWNRNMMAKHRL